MFFFAWNDGTHALYKIQQSKFVMRVENCLLANEICYSQANTQYRHQFVTIFYSFTIRFEAHELSKYYGKKIPNFKQNPGEIAYSIFLFYFQSFPHFRLNQM